jgi:rod shape-determining protein MreC
MSATVTPARPTATGQPTTSSSSRPRRPRPARSSNRGPGRRPSKTVLTLLLLAAFTVITLDVRGGHRSPVEPLRSAAGDVFGPIERGTTAAARPIRDVSSFFTTTGGLRDQVARLKAENSSLRSQVETGSLARNRAAELDGLLAASHSTGYDLVPARVVGMGPAQSFSRTVTIDAGRDAGVRPDMTVLNNDGLVGRVIRSDRSTSTVLLLVDRESVVGGRLGSSMEIGFLRGRGRIGGTSALDLDLVDTSVVPSKNDVLTTWGSKDGAPYVSGVPIGRVTSVYSSPRQLSSQAVIEPFVDFSSLDVVGVVVDGGATGGDHTVLRDGRAVRGSGSGR